MISHSPKCESWQARTLAFEFLVCSLENLYFQYDGIISTSKLPFHMGALLHNIAPGKYIVIKVWTTVALQNTSLTNLIEKQQQK